MQKDFHYYVIYAMAIRAGYKKEQCDIIAYSSQYVDDNSKRTYFVEDNAGRFYVSFPEKIENGSKKFFPMATQTSDVSLEAFHVDVQRHVYAPFHFLPAGAEDSKDIVIDGAKNPYCTVAGCRYSTDLLADAVKKRDYHGIGIALHTYADTWAHDRFSAFEEDWNRNRGTISFNKLPPQIGHAQFIYSPDVISNDWVDNRFGKKTVVKNKEKALRCIEGIFTQLKPKKISWSDVKDEFSAIIDLPDADARIRKIKNDYQIADYHEDEWIQRALIFERNESEKPVSDPTGTGGGDSGTQYPKFVAVKFRDDFESTDWYKFQNAARRQLATVLNRIDIL